MSCQLLGFLYSSLCRESPESERQQEKRIALGPQTVHDSFLVYHQVRHTDSILGVFNDQNTPAFPKWCSGALGFESPRSNVLRTVLGVAQKGADIWNTQRYEETQEIQICLYSSRDLSHFALIQSLRQSRTRRLVP